MAEKVNDAIIEATKTEMPRDVIRWNAMRSMLDDVISYIDVTRAERDRLTEQERMQEEPQTEEQWIGW